jgi:catechol 2,3-dioxygenase-like lactoylglutathione lyase family enzyme
MVTGFHHTGIVVSDLDRMIEFYTRDLGLDVLRRIDSVAPPEGNHTGIPGARRTLVFVGLADDHQIELVHYIDPPAREGHLDKHQLGASHVCFRVEDLRATYARLKAKGVRFVTEPKFHEEDGRTIGVIYARDPEGNWLEFIEGD